METASTKEIGRDGIRTRPSAITMRIGYRH